jgi:hypothetical protein
MLQSSCEQGSCQFCSIKKMKYERTDPDARRDLGCWCWTCLDIADALDALELGQSIEFSTGVTVRRESPTRYVVNEQRARFCFVQAWQQATGKYTDQEVRAI